MNFITNKISEEKYKVLIPVLLLPLWFLLYLNLERLTNFIVIEIINLSQSSHFTEAIRFFIYEVPKVLLLLILIASVK